MGELYGRRIPSEQSCLKATQGMEQGWAETSSEATGAPAARRPAEALQGTRPSEG